MLEPARWATEWGLAQGKVDGEGVHRRGKFKMQSIPEKDKKTFTALLANTPLKEPVELKDLDQTLAFPRFGSDVEKRLWEHAV